MLVEALLCQDVSPLISVELLSKALVYLVYFSTCQFLGLQLESCTVTVPSVLHAKENPKGSTMVFTDIQ